MNLFVTKKKKKKKKKKLLGGIDINVLNLITKLVIPINLIFLVKN